MDDKPNIEQRYNSWILSRKGILVMLFLVLGPFGLGLLYKSRCFSRNAKIFLTIGVLIYTGIITVIFVVLMMYIYRLLDQLLSSF